MKQGKGWICLDLCTVASMTGKHREPTGTSRTPTLDAASNRCGPLMSYDVLI